MKKFLCLAASLLALNLTPVFGQPANPGNASSAAFQQRLQSIITGNTPPQPVLTKFNLDFPGGTPKELAAAIEKAMGKPLNAIIPTEDADLQMPPLKMNDVIVPQLFAALEAASMKEFPFEPGFSRFTGSYGFRTADSPVSDTSIWYFHVDKPSGTASAPMPKVCRFFSLTPYLDRGFTVDDITTAIQTGWKMAGETPTPELNYHKETKLLIAYGEPDKLKTIDQVLQALPELNMSWAEKINFRTHLDEIWPTVQKLQQQVDELTKKVSTSTTNTIPAEKSGK